MTEVKDGTPAVHATSREEWRAWLERHGESEPAVWLIMYKQGSGTWSMSHLDAVADALCYGWIDSKSMRRDDESRYQRFSPRNPKSTWSKINRELAERLMAEGRMRPPGQALIDLAKRTGTWDALADAENGVIPPDLQSAFDASPDAWRNFQAFPPSARTRILGWILTAKRPETRQKRITNAVELAAQNVRANQ